MNKPNLAAVILCLLMASAAYLSSILRPKTAVTYGATDSTLAMQIPTAFNQWTEQKNSNSMVINPQVTVEINKIYADTLSKTYADESGNQIMLSIAYGKEQGGEATQAHRPELCYTAQGFSIKESSVEMINVADKKISVRRLNAVNGTRTEPITYWMVVGNKATLPGLNRKIAQLSYGLAGEVPDGTLIRVSSIQADSALAYHVHEKFINDLFLSIEPKKRERFIGKLTSN